MKRRSAILLAGALLALLLSSPICSSAGWSAAAIWMQRRQGVTR